MERKGTMKLATTTGDFAKYTPSHRERVRLVRQAGFKYIDFSFYGDNSAHSPFMQDNYLDFAGELKDLGHELGIKYVQAHCPNVNPLKFDVDFALAVECTKRSIEVSGLLGVSNAVFHTGWLPGVSKAEYFKLNMRFLERVLPAAEKAGINLCIENSTRANMGDMYYFFTGEDMAEFIEYVGHPQLKACWDTGHANIEGHQYEDIMCLGNRLTAIHFNDNHGTSDQHILPFFGTMNCDEVMHGLLDSGYKGFFTFECDSSLLFPDNWLCKRREYPKDTRLAKPTLEMQNKTEALMYSMGEHILKSYDCFEG